MQTKRIVPALGIVILMGCKSEVVGNLPPKTSPDLREPTDGLPPLKYPVHDSIVQISRNDANEEYRVSPLSSEELAQANLGDPFSESLGEGVDIKFSDGREGALDKPVTISFQFAVGSAALAKVEANPSLAFIGRYDSQKHVWAKLPTQYDAASRTLSTTVDHFSNYDPRIEATGRALVNQAIEEMLQDFENLAPQGARVVGHSYVINPFLVIDDPALPDLVRVELDAVQRVDGCNENPLSSKLEDGLQKTWDPDTGEELGEEFGKGVVLPGGGSVAVELVGSARWNFDDSTETRIQGVAKDQDGGVVKNVDVTATNANGDSYTARTDANGHYELQVRSSKSYNVEFKKSSCKTKTLAQPACGWGNIGTPVSGPNEFELSPTLECERGTATIAARPHISIPDSTLRVEQDLTIDGTLEKTASVSGGKFWEGTWEGTVTGLVATSTWTWGLPPIPNCTTDVGTWMTSTSPGTARVKIRLVADAAGTGLAAGSYIESQELTPGSYSADQRMKVECPTYTSDVTVPMTFPGYSGVMRPLDVSGMTLTLESPDRVTLTGQSEIPFASPDSMPVAQGLDALISNGGKFVFERAP